MFKNPKQYAALRRKYPDVTEDMLKMFIGPDESSQNYYLAMHRSERMLKINWVVLFFGPAWFAYHRMFGWAVLAIFFGLPLCFFANWLFIESAYKKTYHINMTEQDSQKREELYKQAGQTSMGWAVSFLLIGIVVVVLLHLGQAPTTLSGS